MRVKITKPADKDLLKLDLKTRTRILEALKSMRDYPEVSGLVKIKGKKDDRWRLRVGDWRVILRIDQAEASFTQSG
jgi:mRNA interferase RelE/StbE